MTPTFEEKNGNYVQVGWICEDCDKRYPLLISPPICNNCEKQLKEKADKAKQILTEKVN